MENVVAAAKADSEDPSRLLHLWHRIHADPKRIHHACYICGTGSMRIHALGLVAARTGGHAMHFCKQLAPSAIRLKQDPSRIRHACYIVGTGSMRIHVGSMSDPTRLLHLWHRIHADPCRIHHACYICGNGSMRIHVADPPQNVVFYSSKEASGLHLLKF